MGSSFVGSGGRRGAWPALLMMLLMSACGSDPVCECPGGKACGPVPPQKWKDVAGDPDGWQGEDVPVGQDLDPADLYYPDLSDWQPNWPDVEEDLADTQPDPDQSDLVPQPDAQDTADIPPQPDVPPPPLEDGSYQHPYVVDFFPYVQDNDTSLSLTSQFDLYGCADWLGEAGPELVYQVVLPATGNLKVEVAEQPGVDVDIHLLSGLDNQGGMATQCLKRANTQLTMSELAAGSYYVIIDSFSENGQIYDGAFRVAFELDIWDEWQVVEVAPGVVWKKKLYSNYCSGVQTINALEVDLKQPGVKFKPYWQNGCVHPSKVGAAQGAVAATNAGFFAGGCQALCLIKIDGELKVQNHIDGNPRRSFGISPDGVPMFASIDAWADWPQAHQAMGGHPNLVTDGEIYIWPWSNDGFYTARHPRSALGITDDDKLLLVSVDGRTEAGKGMTEEELAQHMIYLGAVQAINLDGGGSTTMWVDGMSINGIVNFPSDNKTADHHGERAVSDALLIFVD